MKIPVEWLKQYIKTDKNAKELAASFTQLGLLLDKPIDTFESNDYTTEVLDLEHRMDRADWLSILGCARDVAAFDNIEFKYPEIYEQEPPEATQKIEIRVEDKGFVNRFYTYIFEDITVTESPEWLKNRLESYGMPSINNIVDITNYAMLEYGQPLHAHDIDKMEKPEIVFRKARNGETLQTLLGETAKLDTETHIITNDDKPTVIGGIVGGTPVAVDFSTKRIVLDSGNYDQVLIRKTSRRLKIQNESVARNDKFLHPNNNELVVRRATKLILELAGGRVYKNVDYYPEKAPMKTMEMRFERLKQIGGMSLDNKLVKDIFERLEYKVLDETKDKLTLEVPFFRTDVVVEDDLVGDILRINDYAKIPTTKIQMAPPKEITPKIYDFEEKIKDILVTVGLHEHITNPLVEADLDNRHQVKLVNSLNIEKSALKTSSIQTLLPVLDFYRKHKQTEIGLFEIGKEYSYENNIYTETKTLGVIYENKALSAYELVNKTKQILATLLQNLGIENYELVKSSNNADIVVENIKVGELGHGKFGIYTEKLLNFENIAQRVVSQISNNIIENLSLVIDKDMDFGPVYKYIKNFSPHINNLEVLEEYIGEGLGKDKKTILLKLDFTVSDTAPIRNELLAELKRTYNIEHRE